MVDELAEEYEELIETVGVDGVATLFEDDIGNFTGRAESLACGLGRRASAKITELSEACLTPRRIASGGALAVKLSGGNAATRVGGETFRRERCQKLTSCSIRLWGLGGNEKGEREGNKDEGRRVARGVS